MPGKVLTTESRPAESRPAAAATQRIVFFDGVCGLCSHTVNALMRRDHRSILLFAPLQGTTAQSLVPNDVREELSTFVYAREGQLFYRSTAMLRILQDLGGFWGGVATLFRIIPVPLRDMVYRMVSSIRYRVFGKHETCRLPTPEERRRFLD